MSKILILIDIQNEYFEGGKMLLTGVNEATAQAIKLADHFRENQMPVFYIRHDGGAKSEIFQSGTRWNQIHESIPPTDYDRVLIKTEVNSFHNTTLHEQIRSFGVKDLVIAGFMTHMCVDGTVRAASDMGYNCTVISDACATRDLTFNGRTVAAADVQAAFLAALGSAYARVTDTETYLKEQLEQVKN